MIDFSKIKLVIWDLDNTFWNGILSEGSIDEIKDNINLVSELTSRGIISSICSKNEENQVIKELSKLGVLDYFVFKSIDWTPKGPRIKSLIESIGLRPVNCLFIDDEPINLQDAAFHCPGLAVLSADKIVDLINFVQASPVTDVAGKRLAQYKVLEKKVNAKHQFNDNEAFLYSTNTRVEIKTDCISQIDRIFELIQRTNQLNFTKFRCSKEELYNILSDSNASCGYVTASDDFGYYGIVGFFAVKDKELIHFLFSCRTIGQGIEQWVYSKLNYPRLTIVGDVVGRVENVPAPGWINQVQKKKVCNRKSTHKIVFKGPCDMIGMTSFFSTKNVFLEVTYGGDSGNFIEHHNHSINYLNFPFLSEEKRKDLVENFLINDSKMFETKMYDTDVSMLFLSTFLEPHLGIYKSLEDGSLFAYACWDKPLTDEKNWDDYLSKKIYNYDNDFTVDFFRNFKSKYVYVGRQTADQYIENLKKLFSLLPITTNVCLILGSEMEYIGPGTATYIDRHKVNKQFNDAIRLYAKSNSRLFLLDFNDFVHSQSDYTNTISHFKRNVYYNAAQKANEFIASVTGKKLDKLSLLESLYKKQVLRRLIRRLKKKFLHI